ncbi:hypothetical protein N665_0168s0007 [Sinapis alba]|nr:hypothetical protein N665_0168s0007 [Sinapis alba]
MTMASLQLLLPAMVNQHGQLKISGQLPRHRTPPIQPSRRLPPKPPDPPDPPDQRGATVTAPSHSPAQPAQKPFSGVPGDLSQLLGVPKEIAQISSPITGSECTSTIMYRRSQAIEFLGLTHHTLFVGLISPVVLASQLTFSWEKLVFLTNFLKVTDGFIGIFTEVDLHTMFYSSCTKSLLCLHLPVDSSGSSSSSLVSFSPEKRTVLLFASFLGVFLFQTLNGSVYLYL